MIAPPPPRDNPREGFGSSYILPGRESHSATEYISNYIGQQQQNKKAQRQYLQKQLIDLEGIGANALPKHQQQLLQRKNDLLKWISDQRMSGKDPYNQDSPEFYEKEKRINQLKADAIKAKMIKDDAIASRTKFKIGEHDDESLSNRLKFDSDTDLDEWDIQNAPNLEKMFDPLGFVQDYTTRMKPEESKQETIERIENFTGPQIRGKVPVNKIKTTNYNVDPLMNAIASDQSDQGTKFKKYAMGVFTGLPKEKQEEVIERLKKKNVSITEPGNEALLIGGIAGEVANDQYLKSMYGSKKDVEQAYENEDAVPRPRETPAYARTPDQSFTKTKIKYGGGAGREAFNERYGTSYTKEEWAKNGGLEDNETSEYVAIAPKTGLADTESVLLTISGKPFKPQGYKVKKNGKVYATGAVTEMVKKGEKEDGTPIFTEKYVPKENVPIEGGNLADVAAHYKFSDVEKFKKWIGSEKGITKSDEPQDQQKTISKSDYAKLSLAERRKKMKEGYKLM